VGLFGKGEKSRDEIIAEAAAELEAPTEEKKEETNLGDQKVDIEITRKTHD
jgi:hypothetical protein